MREVGIFVGWWARAVNGMHTTHKRIGHESGVSVQVVLLVVQHLLPGRADVENGGNRAKQHGEDRREDEYADFLGHLH